MNSRVRIDIGVAVEQVGRIVLALERHQACVVVTVAGAHALLRVIHGEGDAVLLIRSDSDGIDWYEGLTPPLEGEPVFTKWNYDAFDSTDLELWLRTRGIRTTLFVGFTTNVCVETTARHAYIRGFHVVVAGDCTGAPSAAEHEAALVNIDRYFGRVAPSAAIAAVWAAARAPATAR